MRVLIWQVWSKAQDVAFLTSFHAVLMLQVYGPYSEKERSKKADLS